MTSQQSRVCTQLICCIIGSAVVSPAYAQSEGFLRKQLQDYGYPARTQEDIIRGLEVPRPIVRSIATMLVRETKNVDAIPKLVAALGDEDINVRIDAARTLTVLGDNRGITVLRSIVPRHLPDEPPGEKTVSEVIGSCREFWTVLDEEARRTRRG